MPKIVDHDKYRAEIVEKAAPIFSAHGFNGLGMRQVAEQLNMSKSALYHYFPSKEELFAACTRFVVGRDEEKATAPAITGTPEERCRQLTVVILEIEKEFPGELYLLVDYIRAKSSSEIARDENMQHANERYLSMVSHYVGEAAAPRVLGVALGGLVQRLFDGKTTSMDDIERWMLDALLSEA